MSLWLCARKLLRPTCKLNTCLRLHLIQITKLLSVLIVHAPTLIIWFVVSTLIVSTLIVSTLTLVLVITLRHTLSILIFPLDLVLLSLCIFLQFLCIHHLNVSSSFRICVLHEYALYTTLASVSIIFRS